jgi:short-subunit dehydrogenase
VLYNKGVVVTGATSGIGRAICFFAAAHGARVIATGRNEQKLNNLREELGQQGYACKTLLLDVSRVEDAGNKTDQLFEQFGPVDYWFNNAGILYMGEFDEMQLEELNLLMATNLTGLMALTLGVYRKMKQNRTGCIVNISSQAGLMPVPGMAAYAASKQGLVGFSTSLRKEAESSNIRVSVVCFGLIESEILDKGNLSGMPKEKVLGWMRFKAWPTEKAVEVMMKAVLLNRPYILIPGYTKILWLLNRWFPYLTLKMVGHSMKELRSLGK